MTDEQQNSPSPDAEAPAQATQPEPKAEPAADSIAAPVEKAPMLNFAMYCKIRNIPERWMPGMQAFTRLKVASEAQWDAAFKNY